MISAWLCLMEPLCPGVSGSGTRHARFALTDLGVKLWTVSLFVRALAFRVGRYTRQVVWGKH